MAAVATLLMAAAGCGARLTSAQVAALDRATSPAQSGSGPAGSNPLGSAAGPGQSPSAVTTAGTPAGSGGPSATTLRANGPTTTAAPGAPGAGAGTAAGSPLAGPGGRMGPSGAPGSGPGVTATRIKIGSIDTVNGPVPGVFAGARYGTEAAAAYINSLGGICGRQLAVDSADDQFDQATDQSLAQSMDSAVLALVGSFSLQDAGIPAGAPDLPDIGMTTSQARYDSPMNFSPQPNAPGWPVGPYLYFKSNPKYAVATQHMAFLAENIAQAQTDGAWLKAALQSVGYKFVFTDTSLQVTDPTFNGDVQRMKSAGVQGVIFESSGTIIGQLANAMYQAGMKIVLGNYSPPAYDPAYIANAGPGTDGTVLEQEVALYQGQDAALIPMVATFDQWYNRVNPGQTPDIYALYGWASGLMFAQALNGAGAVTRAALLSGLRKITTFTADGLVAPSDPAAKTPPSCWVLIDVRNNHFVRDPDTPTGFRCSPGGYYNYG